MSEYVRPEEPWGWRTVKKQKRNLILTSWHNFLLRYLPTSEGSGSMILSRSPSLRDKLMRNTERNFKPKLHAK